ncbi:MAG: rhamnogalacturonan acetylesterase [Clostridium sp.]|nr:rhamnogalacturonan acetylesterase [Clostridium sp.]
MEAKKFLFGNYEASVGASAVRVGAQARYTEETGFGFIDEKTRRGQERLQLPELNSGFEPIWWYQDEELIKIQESKEGCSLAPCAVSGEWEDSGRQLPLLFKADMKEEGSYRLFIELCNPNEHPVKVILFAGRRHLVWKGELASREARTFEALIHVCAIVPRGKTERYEDTAVDIALIGDAALASLTIKPEQCPVVYIAGDSTVTDQSAEYPYAPGTSYSGWGQMLAYFLPGKAAVSNHAHSGLTTESFREEGHYGIVAERLRAGDYVLIQFAHNDQKLAHLLAKGGYRDNLLRYIKEIREKGAYPILITPIARNSWKGDDNSYNDFLAEYAETVLLVGAEQSSEEFRVPVIDLHKESMEFILRTGLEKAKAWFYPADYTHSNDFGAFRAAKVIAEGLEEICPELFAGNDAADGRWEPEGALELPICPERMKDKKNPLEEAELLLEVERPEDMISRAEVLPMLIQALKFFPTNVYNDMYGDVIGHEWYAGAVECAWQNGIIPAEMTADGCYHPDEKLSLEELMAMMMNGFRGRKQIDTADFAGKEPALVRAAADFAKKAMAEGLSLGILSEDDEPGRTVKRGEAAGMIRSLAL